MKILYYFWGENTKDDMINALSSSGHEVTLIFAPGENYLENPKLEQTVADAVRQNHCDIIFSFNYLPVISQAAVRAAVPYFAWVYDCPHWTLYSPTIKNSCNYLFLFDRSMEDMARSLGAPHTCHLPLAVNTDRLRQLLSAPSSCSHEISFVGSLYEENLFHQIRYLPDELRGFLDGILVSQKQFQGQDLLSELMSPALTSQLGDYLKYDQNPLCPIPPKQFFLSMLQKELSSEERISYLNVLAETHRVSLYTTSDAALCPNTIYCGTASYTQEMPFVFAHSKINLNLTLRSIVSGIPLRALDIMGCGGFLLSNYQPELDIYFDAGAEYVYFVDEQDMLAKTDYYLSHPKERNEIAQNGLKKIETEFSYKHQLQKMFSVLS